MMRWCLVVSTVVAATFAEALAFMVIVPHLQLILPAAPVMRPGYGDCLKFAFITSLMLLPVYAAKGFVEGLTE